MKNWKTTYWNNDACVDGVELVITDSRGHGLFIACQKGRHEPTEKHGRLAALAPELLEACKTALKAIEWARDAEYNESMDFIRKAEVLHKKVREAKAEIRQVIEKAN